MPIRRETADIVYPFVPGADKQYINGIKDAIFQIQGAHTITSLSGTLDAETYLESITQIPGAVRYTFKSIYREATEESVYTVTFEIVPNEGIKGVHNIVTEDSNCYVTVDSDFLYGGDITVDYQLEPARVFWFNRTLSSISFYNEYRNSDPNDRESLSDTLLKTFTAPEVIKVRSGYNVNLVYSTGSGILDIDGNSGNGLGLAPDNMWDEGEYWEEDVTGIISINGITVDDTGDIPVTKSGSVTFAKSLGQLKIEVS